MITTMLDELRTLGIDRTKWKFMLRKSLHGLATADNITILVPRNHQRTLNVRIFDALGGTIARFSLSFMPGCKGMLVLHRMEVAEPYRNRGIAKRLLAAKFQMAKDLRVSKLFCTVTSQNKHEQRALRATGWNYDYSFFNHRTENIIYVFSASVRL